MTDTRNMLSKLPEANTIGIRIRRAREATNLSAAQLARRIGIKTATLTGWEMGQSEPRANRLTMLAGCLSVSPTWLLYGVGEAPQGDALSSELAVLRSSLKTVRDLHERTGAAIDRLEEQIVRLASPTKSKGH
jgi:transcriptional regulator with XRE-family HTH domain